MLAALYFFCLLVGLIYAIIATILGGHHFDFGGGHEVDIGGHDVGTEVSGGELQFSPLSPVVIATFITSFGAMGLIALFALKVSALVSVLVSVVVALAIAAIVFMLFAKLFSVTQSSSEAQISELIGTIGEVITPISATGLGEVAYIQRGSRYSSPAKSADGNPIDRNVSVKIVKVVGNTVYVEPAAEEKTIAE
ncbi:MAG: NfeD family protein [bacterium]|nr:NfeD family protein [bacterium]